MDYILVNEQAGEQVKAAIEKQRIFGSVDQFILLYNEEVINTKKKEIKDIASLIEKSYSNVILQKNKFYVKSKEETYLDQEVFVLNAFKVVAALKRIAQNIIDDGYESDTKLILLDKKPGVVLIESLDEDDNSPQGLEQYPAAEQIVKNNKEIASNPFLINLINDYGYEDDDKGAYFNVYDLVNIDTSFIENIHQIIVSLT